MPFPVESGPDDDDLFRDAAPQDEEEELSEQQAQQERWEEDLHGDVPPDARAEEQSSAVQPPASEITERQKCIVHTVHRHFGHPQKRDFLRVLKLSGASPAVLRYVDFVYACELFKARKRPGQRRRVALPRTYAFHRILGLDVFFLTLGRRSVPILSIICHGTRFHGVGVAITHKAAVGDELLALQDALPGTPTSADAWHCFCENWVKFFGLPTAVITDGGTEFGYNFARALELQGVLHQVTNRSAPWENGLTERHGQTLKSILEKELLTTTVASLADLQQLLAVAMSTKNARPIRGGFSPCQLVFGTTPQLPEELLGDAETTIAADQEILTPAADRDMMGRQFVKNHELRCRMQAAFAKSDAKDRASRALRFLFRAEVDYTRGQWVMIWRHLRQRVEGGGFKDRPRWSGPGVVLLPEGNTIWTAVRGMM